MVPPRHAEGARVLLATALALAAAVAGNHTLPPEDAAGATKRDHEMWTTTEMNVPGENAPDGDHEFADYLDTYDFDLLHRSDPRCPPLGPDDPGVCAFMCGAYDPCPKGQVCCSNNCGGTDCENPVSETLSPTENPQIETTTDMHITEISPNSHLDMAQKTQNKKEWKNRCPVQDPDAPSYCGYMCGPDVLCPGEQICCRNDCGGTQCVDPVDEGPPATAAPQMEPITDMSILLTTYPYYYDDELSTEPYWYPRCPKLDPDVAKPCAYVCSPDNHCPEGQVCCRNKCGGTRCIAIDEPPGTTHLTTDRQDETTDNDWSQMTEPTSTTIANNQEKSTENEKYSSDAQENKDYILRCPKLDPSIISNCAITCRDCPKGKMCCPNNCGGTECMNPVKVDPVVRNEKEQFFWDLYAKNVIHQYEKTHHK